MNSRFALFGLLPLFSFACAVQSADPAWEDPEATPSVYAQALEPTDAASVLAVVNYPGTDVAALDHVAGLDSRAATNIIIRRNGADGVSPSGDDVMFASLAEVDAIPYVGDAAFKKLVAYAVAHPAPASETVEGVLFQGWQSETVTWAANHLDLAALDAVLDIRSANAVLDQRPFLNVAQIGPLPFVGKSALEALRGQAQTWWATMGSDGSQRLGGTFDSVVFDEATAAVALAISNEAALGDFTSHGVTSTPANLIIAARPYTTLAAVANVSGVGPATMKALHDYAASGQWGVPAGPDACVNAFESAVQPHLADLLLMSESDRPIDIIAFPGQGAVAPTAASVLALVSTTPGSTAELRPTENFYIVLEPSSGTADPNAAAAVQSAVSAQLQDVIYVAVHAPAGSLYQAEVNVYLIGRTTCGDLVALHSIAIET